jgi:hypothetical protein
MLSAAHVRGIEATALPMKAEAHPRDAAAASATAQAVFIVGVEKEHN